MDTYFTFKLFSEIGIITIFILVIITIILITIINCKRWIRKINYLESIGFEKRLRNVSSMGNQANYWYIRDIDDSRIDTDEIEKMSLRELKKKYKGLNEK